jgi:molybdate transport system permease protein
VIRGNNDGLSRLFLLPFAVLALLVSGVVLSLFIHVPPASLGEAFLSRETFFALRLSLMTSMGATALALVLGVPSGYLLARKFFWGKSILDTLLDLPMIMTPLVAGVGLLFLFSSGAGGQFMRQLGTDILFTPWGAVLAQTFVAAPLVTRSSRAAFESVDIRYEWAGSTLGLNRFSVFYRITLPMAGRGILAGTVLAWARAMGEFGATLMVAGATRFRTETLPIAVYLNITSGELDIAIACALLLVMSGFVLLLMLKKIGGTHGSSLI